MKTQELQPRPRTALMIASIPVSFSVPFPTPPARNYHSPKSCVCLTFPCSFWFFFILVEMLNQYIVVLAWLWALKKIVSYCMWSSVTYFFHSSSCFQDSPVLHVAVACSFSMPYDISLGDLKLFIHLPVEGHLGHF